VSQLERKSKTQRCRAFIYN